MAAKFEKAEGKGEDPELKRARAYIWRYRSKYPDVYTYSDDEFFYLARKADASSG